jgi:ABC-type transport system involved in multi-copper enzyme maturation permease subunit
MVNKMPNDEQEERDGRIWMLDVCSSSTMLITTMTTPRKEQAQSLWIRALVLTMGILLAGFQVILIVVARSIQGSGGFEQFSTLLPPFARELLGPSLTTFMSFAGIVSLGYFHLAVMGSLIALSIALATMPTSEIETGFMDLLLARPLPRHWIITRTITALILSVAILLSLMIAGTWTGLEALAPKDVKWPSMKLILSLAINLGLLMLCWSGVALAIGSYGSPPNQSPGCRRFVTTARLIW